MCANKILTQAEVIGSNERVVVSKVVVTRQYSGVNNETNQQVPARLRWRYAKAWLERKRKRLAQAVELQG